MIKYFKSKWSYIVYFIIIIIILYEAQGKGDFNIFLSASRDLMLKKNIYKTLYNEWYHYYYDVSFALFLFPFTYFPLYLVKIFWLLLNVFFVFRIWVNIKNLVQISLLKKKNQNIFIILSFIFIFSFIRDNFHLSQLTIFILFSILEGLNLIEKNNKIAGSFLISLGISIKLLPIVIIPYLIYRNQLKPVIYIILFILILLFIPVLFIGYDYNNYLLIERWSLINPINQKHILDTSERSFHSLTTLLSTLLVEECGDLHALPLKRNIANLSIENLNLIINIIRGVLVLSTLYFLNTKPFKSVRNNIQKLYEIGYICLLIPLIFPHQQFYAFFLIFPASTYLIYYVILVFFNGDRNFDKHLRLKKISIIIFLFVAYLLTNSHFLLGVYNDFYDHYKTLTYGVIILLILLAICNPEKIQKKKIY